MFAPISRAMRARRSRARSRSAANSRRDAQPGVEELGLGTFGAVFQSLTPGLDIFVRRSIYWGNLEGGTAEVATQIAGVGVVVRRRLARFLQQLFPACSIRLQAGGCAAFTFFLANGTPVHRDVVVGPQQRVTLDASTVPELPRRTSACASPRPCRWSLNGRCLSSVPSVAGFVGGAASVGLPRLSPPWLFAEGSAASGFDTFYLLMNANPRPDHRHGPVLPRKRRPARRQPDHQGRLAPYGLSQR